jgi:hypothetical protein
MRSGKGSRSGIGRLAHPVDHPVLGVGPVWNRAYVPSARPAPAAQLDLDLALLPLERLVGPLVPDRHRPAAVLALGDLAVEVDVLERVVLGVQPPAG